MSRISITPTSTDRSGWKTVSYVYLPVPRSSAPADGFSGQTNPSNNACLVARAVTSRWCSRGSPVNVVENREVVSAACEFKEECFVGEVKTLDVGGGFQKSFEFV